MLAGNHDCALTGLADTENFNEYARLAIEWTSSVLTKPNLDILKELPLIKVLRKDNALLVHSTPKEPEAWHYLLTRQEAEVNFHYFEQKICFLGHSHHPFIIECLLSGRLITYKNNAEIRKAERYIINAGSVGQPRDKGPRACYVFIADEKIEFVRVKYDIEKDAEKDALCRIAIAVDRKA